MRGVCSKPSSNHSTQTERAVLLHATMQPQKKPLLSVQTLTTEIIDTTCQMTSVILKKLRIFFIQLSTCISTTTHCDSYVTVQEAKPVAVQKSPVNAAFPLLISSCRCCSAKILSCTKYQERRGCELSSKRSRNAVVLLLFTCSFSSSFCSFHSLNCAGVRCDTGTPGMILPSFTLEHVQHAYTYTAGFFEITHLQCTCH